MKVVALISGGKDSCYNMIQCVAAGHEIVALANLQPMIQGECDSYMYQTVGSEAIGIYAEAMQLPLYRRKIQGYSKKIGMTYNQDDEDEVEDLYQLLNNIKDELHFEAVSCGAILSDYQRIRVENVCSRLDIVSLSYLWRRDQETLLQEMIDCGLEAILIKTAALGLVPTQHLGKTLKEMQNHLVKLNKRYGSHICGEGGEYETFTLDCPLFKKCIIVDESEVVVHSDDGIAPVAYLLLKSFHLEEKNIDAVDLKQAINEITTRRKTAHNNELNTPQDFEIKEASRLEWGLEKLDISTHRMPVPSVYSQRCFTSICNIKGMCGRHPSEDDIKLCAKNTFTKMLDILKAEDHHPTDVIFVCLFLADMSHFSTINPEYKKFFHVNPPARVCVCTELDNSSANPDSDKMTLFHVDCISAKTVNGIAHKNMHVQGISHWAPANIGPYSQCVMVGELCFVAGQIGLEAGRMQLVEEGVEAEAKLSLVHVQNILSAVDSSLSLQSIIQCVCYITDDNFVAIAQAAWSKYANPTNEVLQNTVYVTVPALPRKAAVEWQTIAMKNDKFYGDKEDLIIDIRSFTIFSDKSGSLDVFETALKLLQELKCKCERLQLKWDNVLNLRLLYVKRNLTTMHFQDVLRRLDESFDHLPSISCVPVMNVFKHFNFLPCCMALVALYVNDSEDTEK